MTALPVETEQPKSISRIHTLDGLRGLAAIGVMLLHFANQLDPAGIATKAVKFALVTGPRLELLFVLWGFLVTGILFDAKGKPHYFRNFYARRMLRILPLYYGALTILFVMPYLVSAPGAAQFRVPLDDQLWYWFYLQNFKPLPPVFIGLSWHLWSLAIEQQFYLVWPIVIFRTSRETALKICGALVLIAITYRVFGRFDSVGRGIIWPTPARLDGIAVGSALALMMRGPHGLAPLRRYLTPVFLLSVVYISVHTGSGHMNFDRTGTFPLYFTSTAVFFGSLIVYAIFAGDGPGAGILRSRALAFFGRYGYGLYVFHVPLVSIAALLGLNPGVFAWFGSELIDALAYLAAMTALSTAVALVSWHLWEKQFLRLRPMLVKSRKKEAATVKSAAA